MKNIKTFIISLMLQSLLFFSAYAKAKDIDSPKQLSQDSSSLVMADAAWCSTCKAQKKIIQSLLSQPKYKNVKFYTINFDKQKQSLKNFNISMQSTIIAYKSGKEVDRITGETHQAELKKIIDKAL